MNGVEMKRPAEAGLSVKSTSKIQEIIADFSTARIRPLAVLRGFGAGVDSIIWGAGLMISRKALSQ